MHLTGWTLWEFFTDLNVVFMVSTCDQIADAALEVHRVAAQAIVHQERLRVVFFAQEDRPIHVCSLCYFKRSGLRRYDSIP